MRFEQGQAWRFRAALLFVAGMLVFLLCVHVTSASDFDAAIDEYDEECTIDVCLLANALNSFTDFLSVFRCPI
jgi:hypothetical protein